MNRPRTLLHVARTVVAGQRDRARARRPAVLRGHISRGLTQYGHDRVPFAVLTAILLLVCAVPVVLSVVVARGDDRNMSYASALSSASQRITSLMDDQEMGQRAFLLTDDVQFLDPYRLGRTTLSGLWPVAFANADMVGGDAPQLLATVQSAAVAWQTRIAEPEIQLAESGRQPDAMASTATARGKQLFDEFRRDNAALLVYAQHAYDREAAGRRKSLSILEVLLVALGVLGLAALGLLQRIHVTARRYLLWAASSDAMVRAKDEFLSVTSHELRTPVTAIKANAQLLRKRIQRDHLDNDAMAVPLERWRVMVEQLGEIDRHATRLTELLDQLQDVNTIMMHRLELHREHTDLIALTTDIVRRLGFDDTTGPSPRIVLETHHASLVANVDERRIGQVLVNLIHNAMKFSPRGKVVHISLDVHQGNVECAVRDEGLGVPQEDQARLFQLFYRAGNATRHHIGGIGLGLYLARSIVDLHGGRVWMSSEEGRGSTFAFSLPDCLISTSRLPRSKQSSERQAPTRVSA